MHTDSCWRIDGDIAWYHTPEKKVETQNLASHEGKSICF